MRWLILIKLGIEPKKPTCSQIYFARCALPSANGGRADMKGVEPFTICKFTGHTYSVEYQLHPAFVQLASLIKRNAIITFHKAVYVFNIS
jgi:hypothetical protein